MALIIGQSVFAIRVYKNKYIFWNAWNISGRAFKKMFISCASGQETG